MSATAAVVAAQAAQRRKLLRHFISRGAVSAESAISIDTLPQPKSHILDRLRRQGVLRAGPDGRLYLDAARLEEAHRARHAVLARVLAAAAVVLVVAAAVAFMAR